MKFFSRFGSCCRSPAAVAPRLYQDTAPADEPITRARVEEQRVGRMRCSKSGPAAHWRPALSAILEDNNAADAEQFQVNKSGERKLEKKASGRRARAIAKSQSYHGRDDYW